MFRFILSAILFIFSMTPSRILAEDLGKYDLLFAQLILPQTDLKYEDSSQKWAEVLQALLSKPDLSTRERYLTYRQLCFVYENLGQGDTIREYLRMAKPEIDDFSLRSTAVHYDKALDYKAKIRAMEQLHEDALLQLPNSAVPGWISFDLANLMINNYDLALATSTLQKSLATLPKSAKKVRSMLYSTIARLYTIEDNKREAVLEGIRIYDELEKLDSNEGNETDAQANSYNKGVAYLFSLEDYAASLHEFSKVKEVHTNYLDAQVFTAFSLRRLGRDQEASALLKTLRFESTLAKSHRLPFLKCYAAIIRYELAESKDLTTCTTLPAETQSDVVQHITRQLRKNELSPAVERELLVQFQTFYESKIRPQVRNTLVRSIDAVELEKARSEAVRSRYETDLEKRKSLLILSIGISIFGLLLLTSIEIWRMTRSHIKNKKLHLFIQKNILQRFLPPALIEEILKGTSRLEEAPQKKLITILFADLVSFTETAEKLGAERIGNLLNTYFSVMTEVIFAKGGTIDKFMGDSIMVIFGAPVETTPESQAWQAAECGQAMLDALEELNTVWRKDLDISFQLRVGINQGEAVVGSFGSQKRSDYTVIGSAVNLAARVERAAKPGQILLSEKTAAHLPQHLFESVGFKKLKGIGVSQELFGVVQRISAESKALKNREIA